MSDKIIHGKFPGTRVDIDEKLDPAISDRIWEARRGQGDVCIAFEFIIDRDLPLTTAGAEQCEQHMRDLDEGNRELWPHGDYLRYTVYMAQALVRSMRIEAARELLNRADDEIFLVSGNPDEPSTCHIVT
jgi:hypothetical protein